MTNKEYVILWEKYMQGIATPEEETFLYDFIEKVKQEERPWDETTMGSRSFVEEQLFAKMQESLKKPSKTPIIHFKWAYISVAASLLGFIFIAKMFLVTPIKTGQVAQKKFSVKETQILPATTKAVLTLANGSTVALEGAKPGMVTAQGNTSLINTNKGLLIYSITSNTNFATPKESINTIDIPRGGHYEVLLPDHTHVWLNSSSRLTFPTTFNDPERVVQLSGEAYFEVAKNRYKPFKVLLNDKSVVKVFGTHFNIKAYDGESEIKTTLTEGSVRFSHQDKSVMLSPGEQGVAGIGSNLLFKKEVPTDEALAWTSGNFMFTNESIPNIMNQLSRWYDVDITYRGDFSKDTFTGSISHFSSVDEVLRLIQLTQVIKFKIEGRRIIVMK